MSLASSSVIFADAVDGELAAPRNPLNWEGTNLTWDDPIPLNERIVRGKLENGFSYIVQPTTHENEGTDALWFSLYVGVGSVVEEKHERGFAHFIEHLAFQRCVRFDLKNIISFMETTGNQFGIHSNSETTIDSTIYKLAIPMASKLDHDLADGSKAAQYANIVMGLIHDWADGVTFAEIDVFKELRVVSDEFREYQGIEKNPRTAAEKFLVGSSYQNKDPFGDEEAIRNATPAALARFYAKWYNPKVMTLVIAGNIADAAIPVLKRLIESKLSVIQPRELVPSQVRLNLVADLNASHGEQPAQPRLFDSWSRNPSSEFPHVSIGRREGNAAEMVFAFREAQAWLRKQDADALSFADIRRSALKAMAGKLLDYVFANYNGIAQFISMSDLNLTKSMKVSGFEGILHKDPVSSIARIYSQIERAKRFNVPAHVFEFLKSSANFPNFPSDPPSVVETILANLDRKHPLSFNDLNEKLKDKILDDITPDDLRHVFIDTYNLDRCLLFLYVPEGVFPNLTEQAVKEALESVENSEVEPWDLPEPKSPSTLVDAEAIESAQIDVTYENENRVKLGNDTVLNFSEAPFEDFTFSIKASSYGAGLNELIAYHPIGDVLALAAFVTSGFRFFGYHPGFTPQDYFGNGVGIDIEIDKNDRSIIFKSYTKNVRPLLQFVHAMFGNPFNIKDRLNPDFLELLAAMAKDMEDAVASSEEHLKNNAAELIFEFIAGAKIPDMRTFNYEIINDYFNKSVEAVNEWEFFIVCTNDEISDDLKKLAVQYIGSLPKNSSPEHQYDHRAEVFNDVIGTLQTRATPKRGFHAKRLLHGENFSAVAYNVAIPPGSTSTVAASLVSDLVNRHFMNILRSENLIYLCKIEYELPFGPDVWGYLRAYMPCKPENSVEILRSIYENPVPDVNDAEFRRLENLLRTYVPDYEESSPNWREEVVQLLDWVNTCLCKYFLELYPKNFPDGEELEPEILAFVEQYAQNIQAMDRALKREKLMTWVKRAAVGTLVVGATLVLLRYVRRR